MYNNYKENMNTIAENNKELLHTKKIVGIDYKLDYMARLFRSIRNKKFESYAIQRIWHQLNDERVQFVTQQYFKRKNGYALADLYLPQINLVVEIDEGQHNIAENKVLDAIRSGEIQAVSNAEIQRIEVCKDKDEWHTLSEFNQRISEVVDIIRNKINSQGNSFRPWKGDDLLSPIYHKNKGYLCVAENEYVKNIDDAAAIFNTKAIHRGYLRAAGFRVPNKPNLLVWLPSINSKEWKNVLSIDGLTIEEYYKKDVEKRKKHVDEQIAKDETRITFFRQKDALGFNFYKFVGVFKINKEKSKAEEKCIWERIAERYDL